MLKRRIAFALFGAVLAVALYNPLHKMWLGLTYQNCTPEQIVQAYHTSKDTSTVCFLAHSNSTQQNIPELADGLLVLMWTDSVVTAQTKAYVYSTFTYGIYDFEGEVIMTCVRIREALYYEEGVWRVGLGNIIDIGYLHRIKNVDYINVRG